MVRVTRRALPDPRKGDARTCAAAPRAVPARRERSSPSVTARPTSDAPPPFLPSQDRSRRPPTSAAVLRAAAEPPGRWMYDGSCIHRARAPPPPKRRSALRTPTAGPATSMLVQ
eukprot:scaffold373_cov421-Prasinococcus_capsulatus_cf.AAC.2